MKIAWSLGRCLPTYLPRYVIGLQVALQVSVTDVVSPSPSALYYVADQGFWAFQEPVQWYTYMQVHMRLGVGSRFDYRPKGKQNTPSLAAQGNKNHDNVSMSWSDSDIDNIYIFLVAIVTFSLEMIDRRRKYDSFLQLGIYNIVKMSRSHPRLDAH